MHSAIYETAYVHVVVLSRDLLLNWRRGVGSICHWYMCILLYMKLFCAVVLHTSIVELEEKVWVSLPWVYLHSTICETALV